MAAVYITADKFKNLWFSTRLSIEEAVQFVQANFCFVTPRMLLFFSVSNFILPLVSVMGVKHSALETQRHRQNV